MAHLEAHLATPHMQAHHEAVKDDVVDVKIKIWKAAYNLEIKKTIYLSSFLCLRTKLRLETLEPFPLAHW